jgi:hypothetical protein
MELSLSDLRKRYRETVTENENLHTLLSYLAQRPEVEALNIFQRLRLSNDPLAVLDIVKHGDLLLQQHIIGAAGNARDKIRLIEETALAQSPLRVPARPWTSIAGDGIVSELTSSFIALDSPFLFAFIDRDCFLDDMRAATPDAAKYCSPVLVNAICSLRSVRTSFSAFQTSCRLTFRSAYL